MANPTLTAGRAKPVNLVINDKRGNPARVDGMPVWTSSDESVATVTPSDDGMSATILSLGTTGTAQISVTADADLGEAEAGKRRAVLAQRLAEMRGRIEEIREHNGTPFGTMRGTGVVFRFWRDKGRDGAHIEMVPHLRAVPKSEGLIDLYHLHLYGHDQYH